MSSFFSGTDESQLNDRAISSDYFIMLIVNNAGNFIAKVAFKAKRDSSQKDVINFANNANGYESLQLDSKVSKEVLVVMEMDVIKEQVVNTEFYDEFLTKARECVQSEENSYVVTENLKKVVSEYSVYTPKVDELFAERYKKVKSEIVTPVYNSVYTSNSYPNGSMGGRKIETGNQGSLGDDWDSTFNNYERSYNQNKRITEMTDKEWYESQKDTSVSDVRFSLNDYKKFFNGLVYDTSNRNDRTPIHTTLEKVISLMKATPVVDWIEKNCTISQFFTVFNSEVFHFTNVDTLERDKLYMIFLNELYQYLDQIKSVISGTKSFLFLQVFMTKVNVILETYITRYPHYSVLVKRKTNLIKV